MNEPYVSTQISVLKTDRRLIAFYDKLKPAAVTSYAQLHADGEYYENNRKARSLIGLRLLDYSNGTGDRTVSVNANLSPDTLEFIFTRLCAGAPEFSFYQDKIFGDQDQGGYSQVTRLSIIRATVTSNGQPRRIPWIISLDNGKGIAVKNPNGGSYMKKGSFLSNAKVEISLTDAGYVSCVKPRRPICPCMGNCCCSQSHRKRQGRTSERAQSETKQRRCSIQRIHRFVWREL